jgi:hypothetical protein
MADEINYIMSVFGQFRYRKLSASGNRLLKEALQEQRRITGEHWSVFRLWGFTESVPHSTFTLVLANRSRWKLSSREVIVLDEQNGKFRLPYRKVEDFFAFAVLLKIASLRGYATLAFFIQSTYYDFEKLHPPRQINNEADAEACEFEFLEEYHAYTQGNNSLWWGSNAIGGLLYMLTLDLQQRPFFMKFTFID